MLQPRLAAKKNKAGKDKDKGGWTEKTNDEGKVVQELKIEAPAMTEEDQYGYKMPDRYKCDSCRAIMFHLDVAMKKSHPNSRRMKQWEYTDLFDDACRTSFDGYGLKLLNGENTLSGPGLVHSEDQLTPGSGAIQMGGETWGKRLSEACREIVYERIGEDELYDKYREDGGLTESVCFQDIRYCTTGPKKPPPPKESEADKPKEEKPKAKKEKKEKKEEKGASQKAKPSAPEASPLKQQDSGKSTAAPRQAASSSDNAEERIDVVTYLRSLALRHGLTSDEYLTTRTAREWEKLTVAMAGRIFNRLADSEPSESCRANAFGS